MGGKGWRAPILQHFTADVAAVVPLTIAADPDGLFSDATVLSELAARGYDVIIGEDPVALRFVYEARYRRTPGSGQRRSLVVVWMGEGAVEQSLPYDIYHLASQAKRVLSFGLNHLLPELTSGVIRGMQGEDLDRLFDAVAKHRPGSLGANATADFVLRHVYGIAPELVRTPVELLVMLLRRHHQGARLPATIEERLLTLLHHEPALRAWPLERLVVDRSAFLAFLQERWTRFVLTHLPRPEGVADRPAVVADLLIAGPLDLPFDHPDLRAYVDTLFIDGLLAPTRAVPHSRVKGSWLAIGVAAEGEEDQAERLARLTAEAGREIPDASASHRDWIAFALRWAEWGAVRWVLPEAAIRSASDGLERLHETVESKFWEWTLTQYAALHALGHWPQAVMVHHIPHSLAHGWGLGARKRRKALVVVDGLALSQWVVLRETLPQELQLAADQSAAFAWIPTLTVVSRQAIFAGDPPLLFGGSLLGGNREEALWRRFWEDRGLGAAVEYVRQKADESDSDFVARVIEVAQGPRVTVMGVVLGTMDRMIHGAAIGSYGLHCQTRDWGKTGSFARLVGELLQSGFDVTVTSDHGNVEAIGCGRPNEGVVADERGERVRVFSDDATRSATAARFPQALCWPGYGLPDGYDALIAPGRKAFISEGGRVVTHGGISLEEVLVPLITFRSGAR